MFKVTEFQCRITVTQNHWQCMSSDTFAWFGRRQFLWAIVYTLTLWLSYLIVSLVHISIGPWTTVVGEKNKWVSHLKLWRTSVTFSQMWCMSVTPKFDVRPSHVKCDTLSSHQKHTKSVMDINHIWSVTPASVTFPYSSWYRIHPLYFSFPVFRLYSQLL